MTCLLGFDTSMKQLNTVDIEDLKQEILSSEHIPEELKEEIAKI